MMKGAKVTMLVSAFSGTNRDFRRWLQESQYQAKVVKLQQHNPKKKSRLLSGRR